MCQVLNIQLFYINNQKFKQSPLKSLIYQTISKQFAPGEQETKIKQSTARTD